MDRIDETSRLYAYPSRMEKIGEDLVLTTRDFFIILSEKDIKDIKNKVLERNKSVMLQDNSLWVYIKEDDLIIEKIKNEIDFRRILVININKFVKAI